jgi:endonuclease/exonuclease/phosphatase family metal-dependent hydrolase
VKLAALAIFLAGCSLELGPTAPWVDADSVEGPLAAELVAPPANALAVPAVVRVVSFNVEKGADVDGLARAIRSTPGLAGGTIFLLQEIESHPGEGGSRASRLAAALGMGYAYTPERIEGDGTHGPAILSPWPLEHVQIMALPYADLAFSRAPRIALAAEVHVGDAVLHVIDLHLDTRLNATERILQMRPAVKDAPWPAIVGGDLNTNPYAWVADGALPEVPTDSVVDTDQAPVIDDYMRHIDYATPTAGLGPTQSFAGIVDSRLDSIYVRGMSCVPGAVERSVTISDHFPLWIDVTL